MPQPRSPERMDFDASQPNGEEVLFDPAARERELDESYPNRPKNQHPTLPFHTLFQELFDPLHVLQKESKTKKGPTVNLRALGPDQKTMSKSDKKRALIQRYIDRWRREVGEDIYPAFRLIMPDKDRDRAMYGLKEKILAKYLVNVMKIDRNSEDAHNLLDWKRTTTSAAGDFPGRCFEVLQKRPVRVEVGDMTIGEVNDLLDRLAAAPKEAKQLPIMAEFYQRMNAEELMWLIRIILRAMKVGATEKTFFNNWHPDAESLFNISSSLRRVCWELHDPNVRLEGEDRGVTLMQCFQPQLADFPKKEFSKLVALLQPTDDDPEFWIEEKLDGERMQMHMVSDDTVPGGRSFKFWSRKAKEYTYLYGSDLHDKNSSLTRHLKDAFPDDVESIILDGEMITWDMEQDRICAFGTLKTAALAEKKNEFALTPRPLFKVFDILLLNGRPLTQYTLRDRRKALERAVKSVHRRMEIHEYTIGIKSEDIESALRAIIEDASEGLVLKNPRSSYHLADRVDDWQKVKPEYMDEYGENLDCVIIGGYYGSGRRGGGLSSFLCGLRSDTDPEKFLSFFKVGGGMKANDYAQIKHATEGKWHDYNPKKPPNEFIELAGQVLQREMPDMWIKPSESIVIEAKGAQITQSEDFALGLTLRFPRFKCIRTDRDYTTALSQQGFLDLQSKVEDQKKKEKQLKVDEFRKKRKTVRQPLKVVGYGRNVRLDDTAQRSKVFAQLIFYVITDSLAPNKHSKIDLENIIKSHGGKIIQTPSIKSSPDALVYTVADRRTVRVASLEKSGHFILKSAWIFDCIAQAERDFARGLPERPVVWEAERHFWHANEKERENSGYNVDEYGDPFYRDTSVDELRTLLSKMNDKDIGTLPQRKKDELVREWEDEGDMKGWMFKGKRFYFDEPGSTSSSDVNGNEDVMDFDEVKTSNGASKLQACLLASFAGATIAKSLSDTTVTHIITVPESDVKAIRKSLSSRKKIPRVVEAKWIDECWKEGTMVDEDGYAPR
jgi:DNA ligase 4